MLGEVENTIIKQINTFADYSFFGGLGRKTTIRCVAMPFMVSESFNSNLLSHCIRFMLEYCQFTKKTMYGSNSHYLGLTLLLLERLDND